MYRLSVGTKKVADVERWPLVQADSTVLNGNYNVLQGSIQLPLQNAPGS